MTSEASTTGRPSYAHGWIECFLAEVCRLRDEDLRPNEAVDRVSVLATRYLEAAGAQMAEAVGSRDVIGQAKGVLMAQRRIDADQAFQVLKRASQRQHVKIRILAERVAASAAEGAEVLSAEEKDSEPAA